MPLNLKIGYQLPTWGFYTSDFLSEISVKAEKLGFEFICVPDHYYLTPNFVKIVGGDPNRPDSLEAWTAIASIAALTKRVKLGTVVSPIPIYYPNVLAKLVATTDIISGGRIILGAGVGWHKPDFDNYGVSWDSFKIRVERMKESIKLMKKLWIEERHVTWNGKYYRADKVAFWPKPLQKPHPPIWFGGKSTPILEAVAELGDGWIPWCPTTSEFKEGFDRIKTLAKKVGRDANKITGAIFIMSDISREYEVTKSEVRPLMEEFFEKEEIDDRTIFGSQDDCIQKIEEYMQAGAEVIVLCPYFSKPAHHLRLINEYSKVISYFKGAIKK